MQTENEKAIIDAVAGCPGASAGEIARHLGKDRSNVRRDAKRLERDGILIKQNDGGTFRFYLAKPTQSYAPALSNSDHVAAASEPIDGIYKLVTEPAASRALVVSQPADSRTEAALRQHAAAKARAQRSSQGRRIAGQIVTSLDQLFTIDPDGSHTLAAMELAEVQATREKLAREREAASRALAVRPREPTNAEMWSALAMSAIDLWSGMQDRARQRRWEEYQASKQPVTNAIDEPGSDLDRIPWDVRAPVDRIREEQKQAPANPTADQAASRSPPPDYMTSLKARKPAPPEPRSKSWSEWFWGKSPPPVWRYANRKVILDRSVSFQY